MAFLSNIMDLPPQILNPPSWARLIRKEDADYELYNYDRYDDRFGTSEVPPPTREEHNERQFFGAPYRFASNQENAFESRLPTSFSPSLEPEDRRREVLTELPSQVSQDSDEHFKELVHFERTFREELEEEEVSGQC